MLKKKISKNSKNNKNNKNKKKKISSRVVLSEILNNQQIEYYGGAKDYNQQNNQQNIDNLFGYFILFGIVDLKKQKNISNFRYQKNSCNFFGEIQPYNFNDTSSYCFILSKLRTNILIIRMMEILKKGFVKNDFKEEGLKILCDIKYSFYNKFEKDKMMQYNVYKLKLVEFKFIGNSFFYDEITYSISNVRVLAFIDQMNDIYIFNIYDHDGVYKLMNDLFEQNEDSEEIKKLNKFIVPAIVSNNSDNCSNDKLVAYQAYIE